MAVTLDGIKAGLAKLGLKRGDVVLVHSDLRKLDSPRELVKLPGFGANLIIDAFLETVGPEGLVVFPTFTKAFEPGQPGPSGEVYDPATTPSRVGSITNFFLKRPGVVRSSQPTHPVAAIGSRAEEFCEAPDGQSTFDRRGPWGRMHDWDGWVCWFGTDNRTNTTVHVVEDWMDLPYMAEAYALVAGPDGRAVRTKVTKSPAGPRDFYRANSKCAKLLEAGGILRRERIGKAEVTLMRVRELHRVLRDAILRDPCLLLKEDSPNDEWTRRARAAAIEHVNSLTA
ncbi:MAG TPA: AAC(3) family N-acetyltransferase [Phycisphaerae bacterium]|nr:AAC(3) family N-acetyltransferase [Phycisphaerae bacterium]